uniref:ATP synthase subunit a n=1 Tax=Parakontikia atrata TaxID=2903269 RepID=A0A9E7V7Z9_9PLAT|nr:ATP synthase F0 subunit 6 [Parakontikia atrata]UZA66413.1 ATP synthase F0 subunit 6 [Parakontikia atrata]
MAFDIFSSVDFYYSNFSVLNIFSISWFFSLNLLCIFLLSYFCFSNLNFLFSFVYLNSWVDRLNSDKFLFICIYLFFGYFFFQNVSGLFPYSFGMSCHLLANLVISLEVWLIVAMIGISQNVVSYFSHFVPSSSPLGLGVFLCLVEILSMFIRFLTLSLRLSVNMSTGHILLGMVGGSCGSISSIFILFLALLFLSLYLLFDFFISFIQGFVFSLLASQYMEESIGLNL